MTGKEAWSIVAPIILAHSVYNGSLNLYDELYITVYEALKRLDEIDNKAYRERMKND